MALAAFFLIYDYPETASFLSRDERAFVIWRLKFQGNKSDETSQRIAQADDFSWKAVRSAFTDWQVWAGVVMFWGMISLPSSPPQTRLTATV